MNVLNRTGILLGLVLLASSCGAADLDEGLALFNGKQYPQAKEILVGLARDDPDNTRLAYYAGRSFIRSRQPLKAIEYLERATQTEAADADGYYLLGVAYIARINEVNLFRKLGVARKAKTAWIKSLQLDESHLRSRYALTNFYVNAPSIAGGDVDLAKRELAVLEAQHPDYAVIVKALLQEKEGNIEAAYEHFREAERRITDRAFPPFNTAQFLLRQKRYDEALGALNRYNQLDKAWDDPAELFVHLVTGNIYAELNDPNAARRELRTALSLQPSEAITDLIEEQLADLEEGN
jgi:tetratricopeptide (TPR) repeat protein